MLCAPAVVGVELNEYFDTYIPLAINVSRQLRAAGGPEGVRWMCQSWILNLYLDCPSGAGLHCPGAAALGEFDEAVRNGAITWHGKHKRNHTHSPRQCACASFTVRLQTASSSCACGCVCSAFPHNAELSTINAATLLAGADLTHQLDARYNLPQVRTFHPIKL